LLTKLSIQNYALIEDIQIDFSEGFTTISGETGAGKSILLGGLGLILGNRATSNTLMNPNKKCIIEGEFAISQYNLEAFFKQHDVDFELQTIIRRELLPSGKSRAFINDTPVRLEVLQDLQTQLIDVHSQHQTLQLNDTSFQFQILDAIANTESLLKKYKQRYTDYFALVTEFQTLKEQIQKESLAHDYHSFLFDELEKAAYNQGEQEKLETEIERLNNIELIQQNLAESYTSLIDEELGLVQKLYKVKENIERISNFSDEYDSLAKRLTSLYIEFTDIEVELSNLQENDSFEKNKLESLNERLQLLYHLFQKHQVNSIDELHKIQESLSEKVAHVTHASSLINEKEAQVLNAKNELKTIGKKLSVKRKAVASTLEKKLAQIAKELGMPYAQFGISITQTADFYTNGIDTLSFLFSANKGGQLQNLKQVASGGELSRIMLAVKAVMASHSQLPTIIFDEIDSGISGEIALKMATIMKKMSETMQVIAITHLPQIVASGKEHMKVYKYADKQQTKTNIKLLNKEERVLEIAEMLGGKNITETAINHAKQLLE